MVTNICINSWRVHMNTAVQLAHMRQDTYGQWRATEIISRLDFLLGHLCWNYHSLGRISEQRELQKEISFTLIRTIWSFMILLILLLMIMIIWYLVFSYYSNLPRKCMSNWKRVHTDKKVEIQVLTKIGSGFKAEVNQED